MSYSLLHHNTFGVNAQCREFIEYSSVQELQQDVLPRLADERWLHIGAGSNLLFVGDFDGIILHSAITGVEVVAEEDDSVLLKVGAGMPWDDFVAWAVNHDYYGIENLSYIPGEVGASAVQNIGAYGVEVSQVIEYVEVVEVVTGRCLVLKPSELNYSYRYSMFKSEEAKGRYVVTHVCYRLSRCFHPDLTYAATRRALDSEGVTADRLTARMLRGIIIKVRQSKLPEPSELGSAGSFFMNPIVDCEVYKQLAEQYPEMPHFVTDTGIKIPAGWLIEHCGWKGRRVGAVGVYDKQALVIVNYGGASGQDIAQVSHSIEQDVWTKFGIRIHPEVLFVS